MGSPLGVEDIYIFGRILVRSSYIGNEGKSRSEQLIGATQYKEKSKSGYSDCGLQQELSSLSCARELLR